MPELERRQYAKKLHRVLRKNGILVQIMLSIKDKVHKENESEIYIHLFTEEELRDLFSAFSILHTEWILWGCKNSLS